MFNKSRPLFLLSLASLVAVSLQSPAFAEDGGAPSAMDRPVDRSAGIDTGYAGTGAVSAAVPLTYKLQPLDVIKVEVYQEPDLTRELRVEADGSIMLPLVGRVSVGGLEVREAQRLLTELYDRDFIVDPHVSVLVLSYSQQKVQVLGQVNSPGIVLIPPEENMTIVEAISGARGFTRLANTSRVQIRRKNEGGGFEVYEVDVTQILRNPESEDLALQDGDVIFVRERIF